MAAPDPTATEAATRHQGMLTKPPGSLGRLEQLAITLAGQQRRARPSVDRVHIAVFAADHGVCCEGVSAFPQAVTGQMIANFANGGAAISVLARELGATLEIINLGTVDTLPSMPMVVDARIAPGTGNIARAPGMSTAQRDGALAAGAAAATRAAATGADLFIGGDMGIGNTTAAAAIACALLGAAPEAMVGRGTGVDDAGLQRKQAAVSMALARHGTDRNPMAVLASLGGFEIAGLTGAMLECGRRGLPVLVDGYIATAAALVAVSADPALQAWLHFAHRSAEPGHDRMLAALDATPLLDLGMRLGEGSGAATAIPLLRLACALHNGMASFQSAGVSSNT